MIITSNKEKGNLPAPFLRRCIYYFIEFPNQPDQLKQIVAAHQPMPDDLVDVATDRFLSVRQQEGLFKKPGTSEFLDWLQALTHFGSKPYSAKKLAKDEHLPYRELLFKLRADWRNASRPASL